MSAKRIYSDVNEMIDIITNGDSSADYDLGDGVSSDDESELEYVDENLISHVTVDAAEAAKNEENNKIMMKQNYYKKK